MFTANHLYCVVFLLFPPSFVFPNLQDGPQNQLYIAPLIGVKKQSPVKPIYFQLFFRGPHVIIIYNDQLSGPIFVSMGIRCIADRGGLNALSLLPQVETNFGRFLEHFVFSK